MQKRRQPMKLWRDNLDGKRDKQDEDFGARDLIKMY